MLCLSGFELYSRWVPLLKVVNLLIPLTSLLTYMHVSIPSGLSDFWGGKILSGR